MIFSRMEEIAHNRGYFVDNAGVLYSPSKNVVKTYISNTGYASTSIRIDEKTKHLRVHRLMAYQKFGDLIYVPNLVVRHLDGNPLNNSYDNIAIGTQRDNCMDIPLDARRRTALYASSFGTKYDEEQVRLIKEYKKTHGYKATMQEFGISSKATLWFIINRR